MKDEAQGYRVNDTIIFELELYVYGEKKNIVTRKLGRKEVPKQLVVEVPDSTLSLDMDRLFNDDKFSDVKFLVGNVKFPAHKCVLSVRSPMLYAMFGTSGMRETREEVVVVEDVDADIFREVLRFIYTDECSLNILENMPIQLLAAADKYQIVRLKCMCENRLFERMTVDDCADVLVASRHAQRCRSVQALPSFYDRIGREGERSHGDRCIQTHDGDETKINDCNHACDV